MAIRISGVTVVDDNRRLTNYRLTTQYISSNTTAVTGSSYVANTYIVLKLPDSAQTGDVIAFTNQSNFTNSVIDRNGTRIMGLQEDMFVNINYVPVKLQFSGEANVGWVLVS